MSMMELTPREVAEKGGFLDRMPDVKLPKAPPMRVRHLTLWLFILGFGVFGGLMTWASVAQMTSAVVTSGSFRVKDDRLVVQHLEGGILREVNVREGDLVEEGQVLVVIDGTRSRAQLGILRSQLFSALSQEARLQAELDNADSLQATSEMSELMSKDPRLAKLLEAQRSIFKSNRDMLDGQVKLLNERKAQLKEQINGFDARLTSYQVQLDLVSDEITNMEALYKQGLVTGTRMTSLRQNESAIMGNLGAMDSNLQNVLQRIIEVDERILQLRRDRLNTVSESLLRVQETVFSVQERIDAISDVEARESIRAPRSGRVVGLTVNTVGGVIKGGDTLLEIVPSDATFVVETRVKPTDIDEVTLGGKARVRLSAYNFRTTAPVEGTVVNISADTIVDAAGSPPYYRVDVSVTPEELSMIEDVKTLPGMPAQVMIETGEQTLMDYIVSPIMGNFSTALKENS